MSAQDTLAERYGVPSPWRRRALVGCIAVLVLVFGAWLAWTVYDHATPSVTSELESFSVEGDHSVTAVLVIALDSADVKASCTLRAYAEDHTTVGELTFTPDPSLPGTPVQALSENRGTEVKRRAQALAV